SRTDVSTSPSRASVHGPVVFISGEIVQPWHLARRELIGSTLLDFTLCPLLSRQRRSSASHRNDAMGPGCVKSPIDAMILRVNRRIGSAGCQASWRGLIGAKAVCSQPHLRTM